MEYFIFVLALCLKLIYAVNMVSVSMYVLLFGGPTKSVIVLLSTGF